MKTKVESRKSNALPDMNLCLALGWVIRPQAPANGYTRYGAPRKIRKAALTPTQYSQLHRARLAAKGLTKRGTPKKHAL